jgi:hypothetical protein
VGGDLVHSAHRPLLAYCTCPGWLRWRRIWWNEDWQGKPKYSEKTCPSATLSTANPTCQTRARTQATALGSQQLTAWALAQREQLIVRFDMNNDVNNLSPFNNITALLAKDDSLFSQFTFALFHYSSKHVFVVSCRTLSVSQCWTAGWLVNMNCGLITVLSWHLLGDPVENQPGQCPSWDLNQAFPKYKSTALAPCQPAQWYTCPTRGC